MLANAVYDLYTMDGAAVSLHNGTDADGVNGVVQCQIDLATGEKLSPSRCIWQGSGGRFLESPHLYRIGDWYYLMAAEGGTEYGHMITYARSKSLWGPFTGYPHNPVLTNRNKAPYPIQGIGHGDLVQDARGNWHILSLGFRQQALWMAFHHLGREVFLTPVTFDEEGWFTAGTDGTTAAMTLQETLHRSPCRNGALLRRTGTGNGAFCGIPGWSSTT